VVANGTTSVCREFTAGVPLGGVWSTILFNLYIRLLGNQVLHCDLFQYADDATLAKVIRTKEERIKAAEEMNADPNRVYLWGRLWNIKFGPSKCFSLCVSLKCDTDCHPLCLWLLFQLRRLRAWFTLTRNLLDCPCHHPQHLVHQKFTWSTMINQLSTRCRQRMHGSFISCEGLFRSQGPCLTFKSFV